MEGSNKKSFSNFRTIKKFLPYVILFLLTIALMFFFKYNKRNLSKMIEVGKNNLIALAQNLKPLLFQTKITDEDVFNFALYQSLPLDKEKNRMLIISNDESKNNVYEIRPAVYNSSTKNYETFVKFLGLNDRQRKDADSILNSYKKEIYSSILINEKNTVAVNPKLTELQQAALADLISFAQKVDENKTREIFPKTYKFYNNDKISSLIHSAKEIPLNEYILISPDTVARTFFNWDKEKFNKHYIDLEKSKSIDHSTASNYDFHVDFMKGRNENKYPDAAESDYSFKLDSNFLKVVIPTEAFEGLTSLVSDSIRIKLNEAAKHLKNISIPIVIPNVKYRSPKNMKSSPTPGASSSVQTKIIDPYEIVNKTMEMLSKQNFGKWEEFGAKMDSLAKKGNFNLRDSLSRAKFKEEMTKWKKELNKLNEQIKDSAKVKK